MTESLVPPRAAPRQIGPATMLVGIPTLANLFNGLAFLIGVTASD